MMVSKVLPRVLRNGVRAISSSRQEALLQGFNGSGSLLESKPLLRKLVPYPQFVHCSVHENVFPQQFWFSSSASQPTEKEPNQFTEEQETGVNTDKTAQSISQDKKKTDKTEDSDAEGELSMEDLIKLVAEKEALLKAKHKEIETIQDKVLRSYAEMENVIERTKREAENSKKFAIQKFAKDLLDVADNLGRASSVVRESFSKIDSSKDSVGAVPLLKTLLEGVEMTEKQLAEIFRKSGVEKFDPLNEQFDPHMHYAVFQVPDASKPPGTVVNVVKVGYMLYDRVLRPAEVGVTVAVNDEAQ